MNKDLEVRDSNADLQPIMGPMPYGGNGGSGAGYSGGMPDWMEPDPPYGPTDGFVDTIARLWSLIIRWPRRLAIGFLWLTYNPWRFGFFVGTVALIFLALTSKS